MSKARAEIEVTASTSKLANGLNAARAKFTAFAATIARGTGSAFQAVGHGLVAGGKLGAKGIAKLGGPLASMGLDALQDAANDVREFERNLIRLRIATGQTPEQMNEMRTSMRKLSVETGIASSEILAATTNYVDLTGDVAGAQTAMRTFARVAQASGASMSDVSGAAAALGDALQIKPEELEATFSGLINQGKAGAVTLKDFAGELSSLAPKFAKFKGAMGAEGALQLGAAFQVARKGFGSASEAATGLEALMGALSSNAKNFEKAGVKIFDVKKGRKEFRDLHGIITAIGRSKLANDPTALTKAFGSKEAQAAFDQLNRLAPLYDQIVAAGGDAGVVQRDLTTFLESDAGRIEATFNRVKESLAEAFTPERITKFAEALEQAADVLGKIVGFVDELTSLPDIEDAVMGNHNKSFAVKSAIGGDSMADRVTRRALSKELGIDLENMTPEQRARALEQANGKTKFGIENVHQAVRDYSGPHAAVARAQEAVVGKAAQDASVASAAAIVAAINDLKRAVVGAQPTLKLGDNQVAKATTQATRARNGGHH